MKRILFLALFLAYYGSSVSAQCTITIGGPTATLSETIVAVPGSDPCQYVITMTAMGGGIAPINANHGLN